MRTGQGFSVGRLCFSCPHHGSLRIGRKIHFPVNDENNEGEITGVVKDFHFESMHAAIGPLVIVQTSGEWGVNFVYVKSFASGALAPPIEQKYRTLFPDAPFDWDYLDRKYQSLYKNDYEIKDIFNSGLIISLIVSAMGIFSISALILSLKTKEMGIRKVVGAGNLHLFMMHLRPFVLFFLIAICIGLPCVFFLSRQWLENFAYHINLSAAFFIIPVAVTLGIIVLASAYHAIRGTMVNPVDVLKED